MNLDALKKVPWWGWMIAAGGAALLVWYMLRSQQASKTTGQPGSGAPSLPAEIDPLTGVPYSIEGTINPTTGIPNYYNQPPAPAPSGTPSGTPLPPPVFLGPPVPAPTQQTPFLSWLRSVGALDQYNSLTPAQQQQANALWQSGGPNAVASWYQQGMPAPAPQPWMSPGGTPGGAPRPLAAGSSAREEMRWWPYPGYTAR